jgi:hypothetical protein
MATTVEQALDRLRTRASDSPELAEALEFLAAGDDSEDPFAEVDERALAGLRTINRRRQVHHQAELARRALTTPQVVSLIDSMSDRRAVDRRRRRGRLLGVTRGRTVLHPIWQFDPDTSETRDGLDQLLAALGEVSADPWAAEATMTRVRTDLGGRSIADVFAAGELELALRLVRMTGDQS